MWHWYSNLTSMVWVQIQAKSSFQFVLTKLNFQIRQLGGQMELSSSVSLKSDCDVIGAIKRLTIK